MAVASHFLLHVDTPDVFSHQTNHISYTHPTVSTKSYFNLDVTILYNMFSLFFSGFGSNQYRSHVFQKGFTAVIAKSWKRKHSQRCILVCAPTYLDHPDIWKRSNVLILTI